MIIHADSHLDHGLSEDHVKWILATFGERDSFFIETVELPAELSSLDSGIWGPIVGDAPLEEADVTYSARGDRTNLSRICDRPTRKTRLMTLIAGPNGDHGCVLYTAYGGPCAPREPATVPAEDSAALAESEAFWSQHALSEQA